MVRCLPGIPFMEYFRLVIRKHSRQVCPTPIIKNHVAIDQT
jgi:hypothetical protein